MITGAMLIDLRHLSVDGGVPRRVHRCFHPETGEKGPWLDASLPLEIPYGWGMETVDMTDVKVGIAYGAPA